MFVSLELLGRKPQPEMRVTLRLCIFPAGADRKDRIALIEVSMIISSVHESRVIDQSLELRKAKVLSPFAFWLP